MVSMESTQPHNTCTARTFWREGGRNQAAGKCLRGGRVKRPSGGVCGCACPVRYSTRWCKCGACARCLLGKSGLNSRSHILMFTLSPFVYLLESRGRAQPCQGAAGLTQHQGKRAATEKKVLEVLIWVLVTWSAKDLELGNAERGSVSSMPRCSRPNSPPPTLSSAKAHQPRTQQNRTATQASHIHIDLSHNTLLSSTLLSPLLCHAMPQWAAPL